MDSKSRFIPFVTLLATLVTVFQTAGPLTAQLAPPDGPSYGGSMPASKQVVPGIAWFGVLQDGLDQARRTGKPIMLISAAPQCSGVPGMW